MVALTVEVSVLHALEIAFLRALSVSMHAQWASATWTRSDTAVLQILCHVQQAQSGSLLCLLK